MFRSRTRGPRHTTTAVLLALVASLSGSSTVQGQTNDKTPTSRGENEAPIQLKVASNLVVVRVVVRDAQGKPVENLRKADFKLFDRGKEQSITQFDVGTPAAPTGTGRASKQTAPLASSAMPERFIAFYFDNLNASDQDIALARDAADHYLAGNLHPGDRVGIFVPEEMLSDFTSDAKQIHEALFKLRASARNVTRTRNCPDLSDYQALQITQNPGNLNSDAWKAAMDDAAHCEGGVLNAPVGAAGGGGSGGSASMPGSEGPNQPSFLATVVATLAQTIVSQLDGQARVNLHELDQVVKYVSRMPGQRAIIMVSPGFISPNEQFQLDQLIDHALYSQVVISSLDPKGLAVIMRETDASRTNVPATNPSLVEAGRHMDSERELVATTLLADVAHGTGGEFFHNNNDLKAGFDALAGSPVYYILAFTPSDLKLDGKFHELKVALSEKQHGFSIQARRGYFAARNEGRAATTTGNEKGSDSEEIGASNPEAQAQEQIREAVLSKTDIGELPVGLDIKLEAHGDTRDLSVSSHLDTSSFHFHKEGERNLNTVTFIFALFDQRDNLLNAQQRRAKVSILDGQMASFLKAGVVVHLTFQVKPGIYRIREVVSDSEDHHMTTLSRDVTIP